MSVKRAVTVSVPDEWQIGSYVHGGVTGQTEVAMGRYGALVVFQGGKEGEGQTLGRKLGQHVVGEAPVSLGNMDDLPCGESETRLLPQTFLGDSSRTVAQFLKGQQARVLDFVRFQCGETVSEEAKLWGKFRVQTYIQRMCLCFILGWNAVTYLFTDIQAIVHCHHEVEYVGLPARVPDEIHNPTIKCFISGIMYSFEYAAQCHKCKNLSSVWMYFLI